MKNRFGTSLKNVWQTSPVPSWKPKTAWQEFGISREVRPDLIFLDLNMPGRSGWQFIQDLAESEKLVGTPIIVVTSQALSGEARSLLEQSSRAIILKSELSESLVRRVIGEVFPDSFTRFSESTGSPLKQS